MDFRHDNVGIHRWLQLLVLISCLFLVPSFNHHFWSFVKVTLNNRIVTGCLLSLTEVIGNLFRLSFKVQFAGLVLI